VGQFDDAIAIYRSALPSVSEKNAVLLDIALAYFKKGDFENARQQLEPLHRAQPERLQTAILLGAAELQLGKPEIAVTILKPLEKANSQNLDLKYVLGTALIKSGSRRDGVARVEEVAASQNSADAYLLAGATLLQLNEFEHARSDLDAALRLDPKLPGIYVLVGTARDKTGDTNGAEAAFRDALHVKANDFEANLYLGAILEKRRELDEARIYLDRALELNPSSSMARYEFAMLESTCGHYEVAARELEKLTGDDPNWLEPHVQLAVLYYRLHRPDEGARQRQIVDRMTAEQQAQGPGKQ
jgi:tetratricopeptide (TPR) repeat protein